jgi:hypothetical protein
MDDLKDKSSNEILFEIKQMEADYDAIKLKINKELDKMDEIERRFALATKILNDRLKGGV